MNVNDRMRTVAVLVVAWAFVLGIALGPRPAASFQFDDAIGDLVKIFGIGWAVQQFSGDIDGAINDVLRQRDAEIAGATKVVPILRVTGGGGGTAVGAAQVMGPEMQVNKVQAVAEIEVNIGDARARGLIPVSTRRDLTRSVKGVSGVGVSANIKFPI